MKKFQVFLYFASIVVAVVIGMGQIAKKSDDNAEGGVKCPWVSAGDVICDQVPGQDPCGISYYRGILLNEYSENDYRDVTFPQCVSKFKITSDGIFEYEVDPRCVFRSVRASSDGCGG